LNQSDVNGSMFGLVGHEGSPLLPINKPLKRKADL